MNEFTVKNFAELHDVLGRYSRDGRWTFRGHSDPGWELVPKVGRHPFVGCDDRVIFERWKLRAIEYAPIQPRNDWEWLTIAQHHGLATRLLDWTFYPLAAVFFAVRESPDTDAVIFAHKHYYHVKTESTHPFEVTNVQIFRPMGMVPRIGRQGGLFTIHGQPTVPMETVMTESDELEKIIIHQSYRNELLFELSFYGINRSTLFPDLDGLSDYMNWAAINRARWRGSRDNLESL
jgi:FRG domain